MHTDVLIAAGCCSPVSDEVQATVSTVLQIGLGVVWVAAAAGKARSPAATRAAVERLVEPGWAVTAVARSLVPVELLLGVMLIVRWHGRGAAIASAVVFLAFAVALARGALRQSLAGGGCGCFGRAAAADFNPGAGPKAVARNLVLASLAAAAAIGS